MQLGREEESGQGLIGTARHAPHWRGTVPGIVVAACMAYVPLAVAQVLDGNATMRDRELRTAWNAAVVRILDGDPWNEIGDDLEEALNRAGVTETSPSVTDALAGIRAAEQREPTLPANSVEATPKALSELLVSSRLINATQRDTRIITYPLIVNNATNDLLWSSYAVQPEHEATDPAFRLYKRGWAAVPALLDGLDDMTATRSAVRPTTINRPAKLFRRADLAMALLEAITRCRFYVAPRGTKWFSGLDEGDRATAVESARQWWPATKNMPHAEARVWLIGRVDYRQAFQMASLAVHTKGEKAAGMSCLRSLLIDESKDKLRMDVVRQLARFGDLSGIKKLGELAMENGHAITDRELKLLVGYGGRREYVVLRRILTVGLSGRPNPAVNGRILRELSSTNNPLAIPVFAAALFEAAKLPVLESKKSQGSTDWLQADLAVEHIQRLSGRDFRFDANAPTKSRLKTIERVRVWWETEGRGLYGFQSARLHRGGGIR